MQEILDERQGDRRARSSKLKHKLKRYRKLQQHSKQKQHEWIAAIVIVTK